MIPGGSLESMRKVLILPIDIKSREMDARLLHAVMALDAGWQVITGSKTLINRNLWRLPRGVYLFSTLAPGRQRIARCLRRMGFASQGWDEEGLIYGDREIYLRERVCPSTMALIDQIFAWGQAHAEDLAVPARQAGKSVEVAGNPRLDLLHPRLQTLHEEEAARLRKAHGDFVLVTTNLSWANPHVIPKEQKDLHAPVSRNDDREGARSYLEYQKRMLKAFRSALPALARALPDTTIVLRPHPVENLESWKELLSPFPNVRVIRQGGVIPWILASRILLHSNSTTGLEACLLGSCPVAYVPFTSPRHESPLPNGVSLTATTENELVELISGILSGSVPDTSSQEAFLNRYIHRTDDLLTGHFLNRAEELLDRTAPSLTMNFATRAYLLARHVSKAMRRGHARDTHRRNIYPDTEPEEIASRARLLARCIGAECAERITVRPIVSNIYEMTLASR